MSAPVRNAPVRNSPVGNSPARSSRVRIYLAGPLGFSEAGRHFYNAALVPYVRGLGFEVLDPWALTDPRKIQAVQGMPYGPAKREAWRALNLEMGATNRGAIDDAQVVVAVLDGVDVDSGTAAEIGYAFARGKRIVGYRGDFRLSADNEGSTVNLQVEYFIRASGGTIVERYEDLGRSLRALAASGRSPRAAGRRAGARRRVR
jgi:nucleoside 2-deoxyribosyltransferase